MAEGKQSRFDLIIGATDRFSGPFKSFESRLESAGGKFKELDKRLGVSRMAKSSKEFLGSLNKTLDEGQRLVGGIIGMGAKLSAAMGLAGGGAFAVVTGTSKAGEAALVNARKARVATKAWQELSYAGETLNVTSDQMQGTLTGLGDTAREALRGNVSEASQAIRWMGVQLGDTSNRVRRADALLLDLADKFSKMEEGGKKDALLKSIFGDSGKDLEPLLNKGKAGIAELSKEAHRLGLVFSDEAAASSKKFNTDASRLKNTLLGLGYGIGTTLMPYVNEAVDGTQKWAMANRDLITGKLDGWMGKLKENWPGIKQGFFDALDGAQRLGAGISRFVEIIGGWDNAMIGVGLVMAGPLISSMFGVLSAAGSLGMAFAGPMYNSAFMAAGLFKGALVGSLSLATKGVMLLGASMAANPLAWVAGLAAGAVLVYKNWDSIAAFFGKMFDKIGEAWDSLRSWLPSWLGGSKKVEANMPAPPEIKADWAKHDLSKLALPEINTTPAGMSGRHALMAANLEAEQSLNAPSLGSARPLGGVNHSSKQETTRVEKKESTVRLELAPELMAKLQGGDADGVSFSGDLGVQGGY